MKFLLPFLLLFIINIRGESLLDKVKNLDFKILNITKSIEKSDNLILKLEKKVEKSNLKIKKLKKNNSKLEINIKKRVKYLFKIINGKNFLYLIDAKDALTIERKEKFLKIVINHDINMIKDYLTKLLKLNEMINLYDEEIKKLKATKQELLIQKENLIKERKEKKRFIRKINKSKHLKSRLVKEKRAVSKKIIKKLKNKNSRSNFLKQKGKFDFPVNSKVYKWYYVKYIKSERAYDIHKGLTFKVPEGTRVHSIYKGVVVFASYIKGYGNTIIISHGEGYYTIYMHLSKILKKSGEKIESRDIIALTGDTGSTEYPKLYFEIRKKKNPINLNKWFNIKK